MPDHPLHAPVVAWYARHARDLPWRRPDVTPWGVLVSEVMLQQTPVARVLPVWAQWLGRWPDPPALAAEPAGEAVRAWGRLGYPRRALRLHATATSLTEHHGGRVPADVEALRALPGVGEYTAAAVASFAFGGRHAVLDTNVRRVLARAVGGTAGPAPHLTAAERARADALLPDGDVAADWAAATMELGAVVCRARDPQCAACPIAGRCAWFAAGRPAATGPARRPQAWHGTDRQARGAVLAALRESPDPVPAAEVDAAWPVAAQRDRAVAGLIADGLVVRVGAALALPG